MSDRGPTRPLFVVAHLAVTPVTTRHDIGDEIARRAGTPMVTTACGQEVVSTLTTRRTDLVRCPACKEANSR